MARSKQEQELFDLLRARGLRKRVARTVAEAASKADGSVPKPVRDAVGDLRSLAAELESRVTGKPARRSSGGSTAKRSGASRAKSATGSTASRSEAAKKAAATRKRNAAKRSTSAKKASQSRSASSRSAAAKKAARTRAAKSR